MLKQKTPWFLNATVVKVLNWSLRFPHIFSLCAIYLFLPPWVGIICTVLYVLFEKKLGYFFDVAALVVTLVFALALKERVHISLPIIQGVGIIYPWVINIAIHRGISQFMQVEESEFLDTKFMHDANARRHFQRVSAGMRSAEDLKERWANEIAPLLPAKALPNGVSVWSAQLFFFLVSLPSETTGGRRDNNYHVSHSGYAILDFCIYSFFEMRRVFCASFYRRIVEKIEVAFFDYLSKYFVQYFSFSQEQMDGIIDDRLDKYESIMRESYGDIDVEMLGAVYDFIIKDFHDDPLQKQTIIVSAEEQAHLCSELTALMHAAYVWMQNGESRIPSEWFFG